MGAEELPAVAKPAVTAASGMMGQLFGGAVRRLQQVLPSKNVTLPAASTVVTLMKNRPPGSGGEDGGVGVGVGVSGGNSSIEDSFLYLDPKNEPTTSTVTTTQQQQVPRFRGAFRKAVVCMVGGGSHSEAQG